MRDVMREVRAGLRGVGIEALAVACVVVVAAVAAAVILAIV